MHLTVISRLFQLQNTLLVPVFQTNPMIILINIIIYKTYFLAFPTVLNFPIPEEMGESEYWKIPFGNKGNKADKFSNTHKLH